MDKKLPSLWGGLMQRLKLGSVMDSLIAVLIVFGTLFAVAIIKNITWLMVSMLIILVVILVLFIVVYVAWSFKDPDKLRSSEHEIQKLQIMHGIGDNTKQFTETEAARLPSVDNPELMKKLTVRGKKS